MGGGDTIAQLWIENTAIAMKSNCNAQTAHRNERRGEQSPLESARWRLERRGHFAAGAHRV
jgi:hypothetical protein